MAATNSKAHYGWVAITLHWAVALVVSGMFALGLWMVGLTYYDDWYRQAPHIHKSIGMLLLFAMAFRLVWRSLNTTPAAEPSLKRWERWSSHFVHWALYVLLFALMVSGYLISTAKGDAISVFGWFDVPATITGDGQEDVAGDIHLWLAWTVVILAALHALAALKHHFINRDDTLRKMLGSNASLKTPPPTGEQ